MKLRIEPCGSNVAILCHSCVWHSYISESRSTVVAIARAGKHGEYNTWAGSQRTGRSFALTPMSPLPEEPKRKSHRARGETW
jgi:hypothetical protein